MSHYYIYCNNNQAYHALLHNSIVCRSLKSGDFGAATASFLSESAVFVTREKLPTAIFNLGTSDVYYPTILEICDGCDVDHCESSILGWVAYKEEGSVLLSQDSMPLNAYDSKSGYLGAFVFGEIPICYLSAILFTSNEDMKRFKKSSPDLWFPQDLFGLFETDSSESTLSSEVLAEASAKADKLLTPEMVNSIQETVLLRDRAKAAAYFMVEATDNWSFDDVKANVDGALIRFLDDKGHRLQEKAERAASAISNDTATFQTDGFMDTTAAWEDAGDAVQNILLSKIKEELCAQRNGTFVDLELFQSIARGCKDAVPPGDRLQVGKYLTDIQNTVFLHTELEPEMVLSNMSDMPVLCAFFLFLNQSSEMAFLRNVCEGRPQVVRRYTYMMFGWYHGMAAVDGREKSNRSLERRLTEIVVSKYPNDVMISRSDGSCEFCAVTQGDAESVYGITPHFFVWYSCEASRELLLRYASADQLEHVCKLLKDPNLPLSSFRKYKQPIAILPSNASKAKPIAVLNPKAADGLLKWIKEYSPEELKNWKASFSGDIVFDSEAFRQAFLSDEKRYQRFYKKHCDEIQNLCREVKQ